MHLSMVGHDKGDGSLQQTVLEACKCGAGANIEIRGPVDKKLVPEVLLAGDIFLNTSNEDNTPVSVMEAMASGMCVVSTKAGGVPYLIEAEKEGLLVPVNDDSAMAAAVARILREPELAPKLQEAAFARIRKADWSQILPQWQELLATVASRKPRPVRRQVEIAA
jgi:glycosyltransferase involved in cell wall biosynthesis